MGNIFIVIIFLFLLFVIWLAVFSAKKIFKGWHGDIGLVEESFYKMAFTIYSTFFTIVIVFLVCILYGELVRIF